MTVARKSCSWPRFAGNHYPSVRLPVCPWIDAHLIPLLVLVLEAHLAIDDGEQRVVGGAAHVHAGMELGAPLFHEDRARRDVLPGEALHAEILRPGVAAVAGRNDADRQSTRLNSSHSPIS